MTNAEALPPVEFAEPLWDLPENWIPLSVQGLAQARRELREGFVPPYDPILREPMPCIAVDEINSARTHRLVDELMRGVESSRKAGVRVAGASANQIGVRARIAVVDSGLLRFDSELSEPMGIVNLRVKPEPSEAEVLKIFEPEAQSSDEAPEPPEFPTITAPHGCLSCLEAFALYATPQRVVVSGWTKQGKEFRRWRQTMEGYSGVPFAHERFHLKGKLMPDLALRANRHLAVTGKPALNPDQVIDVRPRGLLEAYRACIDEGWQAQWPYKMPVAQWKAMRKGTFRVQDFYG